MKRIIAIAITVFLALAMLAGCSAGKSANDSSGWSEENSGWGGGSAVAPQAPATDQAADYDKGLTGGEIADYESQRLTDEMYGGRKVIRTYDFDLQTDDFDNVLAAIQQRLSDYNGYSLNTSISGRKPTVCLNPRAPSPLPAFRPTADISRCSWKTSPATWPTHWYPLGRGRPYPSQPLVR